MKPYFSKFLPTEGEIKEGDKYFAYKTLQEKVANFDNPGQDCIPTQKAKLYLCSRDIQVGDVFKIDTPDYYFEERTCIKVVNPSKFGLEDNQLMYMINKTGAHLKHGECFKVIGEISPNAIWVTEGMEFDENDFKQFGYDTSGNITSIEEDIFRKRNYLSFKCPTCKTFH